MTDLRPRRVRWSHVVSLTALTAALALSGACGLNFSHDAEARDVWQRTYTLSKGASFEIKNTNGRIRIVPIDGDVAEVKAERIVKAATEESAKAALQQFEISESASPTSVVLDASSRGMGFTVRLQRRVDFEVRLPRWANVRLGSTNGDIEVSGLQGAFRAGSTNGRIVGSALEGGATVETTNGVVNLDFAKLTDAGVTCETTNGTISVTVPRDTGARISARVTNGEISTSDLQLAVAEQTRRRLDASIGGGGPSIKLETTNGSIEIRGR
jgi:putative adhesin